MESVRQDIDSWEHEDNQLIINLGQAVKLKVANPDLRFQEDYSIKEFQGMTGELTIFGLSPYNDYHLFEMIDNTELSECIFYYYDYLECERIKLLLFQKEAERKLVFKSVKEFWERL